MDDDEFMDILSSFDLKKKRARTPRPPSIKTNFFEIQEDDPFMAKEEDPVGKIEANITNYIDTQLSTFKKDFLEMISSTLMEKSVDSITDAFSRALSENINEEIRKIQIQKHRIEFNFQSSVLQEFPMPQRSSFPAQVTFKQPTMEIDINMENRAISTDLNQTSPKQDQINQLEGYKAFLELESEYMEKRMMRIQKQESQFRKAQIRQLEGNDFKSKARLLSGLKKLADEIESSNDKYLSLIDASRRASDLVLSLQADVRIVSKAQQSTKKSQSKVLESAKKRLEAIKSQRAEAKKSMAVE